jgi:hypothetical protein
MKVLIHRALQLPIITFSCHPAEAVILKLVAAIWLLLAISGLLAGCCFVLTTPTMRFCL